MAFFFPVYSKTIRKTPSGDFVDFPNNGTSLPPFQLFDPALYPNFVVRFALSETAPFDFAAHPVFITRFLSKNYPIVPPLSRSAFSPFNNTLPNVYVYNISGGPVHYIPVQVALNQQISEGMSLFISEALLTPKYLPAIPESVFQTASTNNTQYILDSYGPTYVAQQLEAWLDSTPAWEIQGADKFSHALQQVVEHWSLTWEAVNGADLPEVVGNYYYLVSLPVFDSASIEVSAYCISAEHHDFSIDSMWVVALETESTGLHPSYVGYVTEVGFEIGTILTNAPFFSLVGGGMLVIKYNMGEALNAGDKLIISIKARPLPGAFSATNLNINTP